MQLKKILRLPSLPKMIHYFVQILHSTAEQLRCGIIVLILTPLIKERDSGKFNSRRPISKWEGVTGSSKQVGDTWVSGLEFTTISTSMTTVLSSSRLSLARQMIFLRHLFTERINLSNTPPHHGAFSTLNFHSTQAFSR